MIVKIWTREGEKTKDAQSLKESAYTDHIIIVNEQKEAVNIMFKISPHMQYYRRKLFSNAL